jgi:hypothetical protein
MLMNVVTKHQVWSDLSWCLSPLEGKREIALTVKGVSYY